MPTMTVLSHSEAYYSTLRLMDAGRALGWTVSRLDPVRVVLGAGAGHHVTEDGIPWDERLSESIILPRIGARLLEWSAALLTACVAAGAKAAVRPDAIRRAADKLVATHMLHAAGLPVIPTLAVREQFHVDAALDALGGRGWVFKRAAGTGGDGVVAAPDRTTARAVLQALIERGRTVLAQPLVQMPHDHGVRDLRVLVLGGEAVAGCWRYAAEGEFRANVHRGGQTRSADLEPTTIALAERAAEALGLPFCGIDLIETEAGWAVLEANGSPGLEGVERATGRDLATEYLTRYAEQAR